jgi:hemolysin III
VEPIGSATVETAACATRKGSRDPHGTSCRPAAARGRGADEASDAGGGVMIASAPEQVAPRLRGVSHAVASVVAIAAAIVVVALAPTARTAVALAVYGAGLIALFCTSALYHRWPGPARFKPLLQRIDHSAIYVFIAASYTPIAVVLLHSALVWMILVVAWAGAAAGVAFTLGWIGAPRVVVVGSYLALGWIGVVALPQLMHVLGFVPLALLGAGGVFYSVGAIVFATHRPDPWPRTFGFHEVFHALVIAAAAAQYVAIVGWVLPAS